MATIFRALLLGAPLLFVGFAPALALDDADVPRAVENAKTAAEHEAIAAYWEQQASAARATVARRRALAAIYSKHVRAGSRDVFAIQMKKHCEELAKTYEQAAENFDALALAHHADAKAAR